MGWPPERQVDDPGTVRTNRWARERVIILAVIAVTDATWLHQCAMMKSATSQNMRL